MTRKHVVVLGAGLAGLRTASVLIDRNYDVTVLERAPMAGGCTSSWTDHRDPGKGTLRRGQMQMNFNFYENLNYFASRELDMPDLWLPEPAGDGGWWARGSSAYSDRLDGFHFFDHNGRHSHLSATPKSLVGKVAKSLPAPLAALQILWDFDGLPSMRDKLSAAKFHALALLFGRQAVPPVNDDWNFYGLMKEMGLSHEAILAYRRITYSITNLCDADQVGPKFMHLFYLAYLRDRDTLGCRMMNDDCNDALIDPIVASLTRRGVKFRLNCAAKDFLLENDRCHGVIVEDHSLGEKAVCANCGLKQPVNRSNAMCNACGTYGFRFSTRANPSRERIDADHVVSSMQPHQLAKLYRGPDDHPLRKHPMFRALGQMKGAQLTVSRIYMDEKVTEGYNLTGLDRDHFSFNGIMDLSHVFGKFAGASVFDTLSDDGEVLEYYPIDDLKDRILGDAEKVFPGMRTASVRKHLIARIGADVLYHRPVTRLNTRFLPKGPVTPVENLFLAGDWVDEYELGKEAAVRSGVSAANAVLETDGRDSQKEPVLYPQAEPLVRFIQNNPVSGWIQRMYWKRYHAEKPPRRG